MKIFYRFMLLPMLLLLLLSCSDINPGAPSDRNVHRSAWMNPGTAENHGLTASQEGNESCKACHGSALNGSGDAVSCFTCHFDQYGSSTPDPDWTHGQPQHAQFSAQGEICNGCHNANRVYGYAPPAEGCHDCHAEANHPLGQPWLDKQSETFHGNLVTGLAQCARCHGEDFKGGLSAVSCFECHFDQTGSKEPAGESWTHDTNPTAPHDDTLLAYIDVCNQCHTVNRTYGNAPPADNCHDCHGSGASHQIGETWLLRTQHATAAIADPSSCEGCHPVTDCRQCHVLTAPRYSVLACSSCHGTPSSTGKHSKDDHAVSCDTCHSGSGANTLNHYDQSFPADVKFNFSGMSYDGSNCTGTCHNENHNDRW